MQKRIIVYFLIGFISLFSTHTYGAGSHLDNKELIVNDSALVYKNGNVGIGTASPMVSDHFFIIHI